MPCSCRALGATLILIAGIGTAHAQSAAHIPVHTPEWSNPGSGDPGHAAHTAERMQFEIQIATSDLQNAENVRGPIAVGRDLTSTGCQTAIGGCAGE